VLLKGINNESYKLSHALLNKQNLLLFHFQIMIATLKNTTFLDMERKECTGGYVISSQTN